MSRTPHVVIHVPVNGIITMTTYPGDIPLSTLQGYVGGSIQLVSTRPPVRDMYVNEEGLINDLPVNVAASALIHAKWNTAGGVRGDAVIVMTEKQYLAWKEQTK